MRQFFLLILPILIWADAHIFVYHRFGDLRHSSTNTSIQELEKEFEYLKKNNYKVVKLSKLVDMLKNKENLDKIVALTIDDSYKSFYQNGFPIFKKYHYPFTLYVYVEGTNKKYGDFMSWKQIKEVSKYGEIGLHSYSHPHLPKLSNSEIETDTQKAYKIFEKKLGFRALSYAYPYGEYDNRVKNIIKSFGFQFICNQNAGAINNYSNIYDLDRIALTGKVNISKKLRLKRLNIQNFKVIVETNIIKEISGVTDYKSLEVYITNFGWKRIKIFNKKLIFKPNFKLKKFRNRVIIRYNNEIVSKMITKR